MKMIFAGVATNPQSVATNFLYNCTRNKRCQPEYFIPIRTLADLMLYVDFSQVGKPTSVLFNIIACDGTATEAVFCNYVVGQTPQGSWYGVFTGAADVPLPGYQFYIEAIFSNASGGLYKFYTNQFEYEEAACDIVSKISACYPNEETNDYSFDCNGIYYGYHTGGNASLGNSLLRYYHWVYVRSAVVIEQNNKMTFTQFNSKRVYRNEFERTYSLQFETVPKFYKDVVIGVYNRGNIEVDGEAYTLSVEQEFEVLSDARQMWRMNASLTDLCKQYFGCNLTDCIPAPPPCTGNFTNVEIISNGFQLTNGFIGGGESIDWELLVDGELVDQGNTNTGSGIFDYVINEEEECYDFVWRKRCTCSLEPYYSNEYRYRFGLCGCCDPVVVSADAETIPSQISPLNLNSAVLCDSYVGPDSGGVAGGGYLKYHRIKFSLSVAYPEDVVIDMAFWYRANPPYIAEILSFGTDMLPVGHYAKSSQYMGYSKAFRFTIPAGTLEYTTNSLRFYYPDDSYSETPPCRDNENNYDYAEERFFLKVVSPNNGLVLTFMPISNSNGYSTTFEQIV